MKNYEKVRVLWRLPLMGKFKITLRDRHNVRAKYTDMSILKMHCMCKSFERSIKPKCDGKTLVYEVSLR